jgi:hypothetical protein
MPDSDAGPDGSAQDTGIMESGIDASKDSASMDGGTDAQMDAGMDGIASDGGSDGSKKDGSPMDATIDVAPPDGGCNNLINGASQVTFMQSNQQAPSATGGSVTTGLYYLTTMTIYNGQTGSTGFVFQLTIDLSQQGTLESVIDMSMNPTQHASFNWSANNTTFTLTATCLGSSSTPSYTANNMTLKLYADDGMGNTIEEVFTHQ